MNLSIYLNKGRRVGAHFSKMILLFTIFQLGYQQGTSQACQRTVFRSVDGTCNNLGVNAENWGAADIPIYREMTAVYDASNPLNAMITNRANPRKISNEIFSQTGDVPSKNGLSSLVFTWGQFLDHDIDISPEGEEKHVILLPDDEPDFTKPMTFTRSQVYPGTGTFNTRAQTNKITSWIDGSQVYGSDSDRANWLRTKNRGKLKTSRGNLLPFNTIDGEANSAVDPTAPDMASLDMGARPHFVAGDVRASEQPGLTALHTLFVREHNRICEEYFNQGIRNDEVLYQLARKKVAALMQSITYNEFLPALGVQLTPYTTYNANTRPDIMNVFSTAAYRIGHTMVTSDFPLLDDQCQAVRENLTIEEAFFNARWIGQLGIEPFFKGLSTQVQQEVDAKVIDGLRNFLFNIPQVPGAFGLDLAALNIQRGRDHGLQDYNAYREYFTGSKASSFEQINSDPLVRQKLQQVYGNDINNIDAWVGMLCEEHIPGGNMGITIHNILKAQFERVRDGDFYYYKNDPYYRPKDVQEINTTKLADIIHNNTTLTSMQANVFKALKDACSEEPSDSLTTIACGTSRITYGNGSINMTTPTGKIHYYQVFDKSWKTVFSCGWRCGNSQTVDNLAAGTYRVFIYNETWSRICEEVIDLSGPGSLVDADKDGVAQGVDCNDNDPNLTTVGATCDDGNPATINDRVLANCTCIGTPNSSGGETIACNNMTITYGNGSLVINGIPNNNFKFKIERTLPGWSSVENCVSSNCGTDKSYQNLSAGDYSIRIWSDTWEPMCDLKFKMANDYVEEGTIFARLESQAIVPNTTKHFPKSALYPNPANTNVLLTLPEFVGQKGVINIINNLGQQVSSVKIAAIADEPIGLNIQRLVAGLYQVQAVIGEKHVVNHKLVIKR